MTSPSQTTLPCAGCGATVEFAPGTNALRCPYCGHQQQIATATRQVHEHSFDAFLARPRTPAVVDNQFACPGCGAKTRSDALSKQCQFCGTGLIADTNADDQVSPEAVLPFTLDKGKSREALRGWVKTRWFAPNRLKKVSEAESMKSTYLPHWTFDAGTVSDYVGQRGDHYYETQTYTENGETKTRQVRKTRWRSASGTVSRAFDDVLVPATQHVTKEQLDTLEPWPLNQAQPYQPSFVAGHHTLRYDIGPESGLELAKGEMAPVIEGDCRSDIGGDEQRVHEVSTSYSDLHFKLLLLPVWVGCYLFGGKTFQIMINGVTGEVHGERPFSAVKITLAVLAAVALVTAIIWLYMANKG